MTWIDGKHIFHKIISGTMPSAGHSGSRYKSENMILTGVGTLVSGFGMVGINGTMYQIGCSNMSTTGSMAYATAFSKASNNDLYINSASVNTDEVSGQPFYVKLFYTKA